MEFFSRKLRDFANIFAISAQKNQNQPQINRCELYLEQIYKVLNWEDNATTLKVFLFVNFLFWLIVQWQMKLLGIVFLMILIAFVFDSYIESKNMEVYQGEYYEAYDQFHNFLNQIVLNLKSLRKESPSTFTFGMSLVFFILSIIAKSISGYVLSYIILLGIFFVPLGMKYLPEEYSTQLKQMVHNFTLNQVLAEEELIPFISKTLLDNRDPDNDSLLTDKTQDSLTNSLASGISSMPSYLDEVDGKRDIEEEDLVPDIHGGRSRSYTPRDLSSSDSDSEHREIRFDSKHFKESSSSSDENLYSKGLKFTQDMNELLKQEASNILSNIGSKIVSNISSNNAAHKPMTKTESSESEFEIIDEDDVL